MCLGPFICIRRKSICYIVVDACLIWEFPKMKRDEFLAGVVTVDVFDANTILRNEIIGRYELDLR